MYSRDNEGANLSYYRQRKITSQIKDFTRNLMRDGILNRVGKDNQNYNLEFYTEVWMMVRSNYNQMLAGLKPKSESPSN